MLVTSNFSFSHDVFHSFLSTVRQNAALCGNGLNCKIFLPHHTLGIKILELVMKKSMTMEEKQRKCDNFSLFWATFQSVNHKLIFMGHNKVTG